MLNITIETTSLIVQGETKVMGQAKHYNRHN